MGHDSTVYVVDDDSAFRTSLRLLCESVGLPARTFASSQEFLEAHKDDDRGCLILDIRMPGGSGFGLLERLGEMGHDLPVIVLTGFGDVSLAVRAMKQGAVDFLEKTVGQQELLDRIQDAIQRDVANHASHAKFNDFLKRLESLTERERQVMDLVVDGLSSKDIAAKLGISFKTIEAHRARIMKKMDVRSVTQLIRQSLEIQHAKKQRAND